MKTVAILTPTYNRAYILDKLYNSLLSQSLYDFKWYIVDDGSVDDTEEKCRAYSTEKFEILYVKKENGGKHTALNVGIGIIEEELTFIVDSDDYLTNNAVQTIVEGWEKYKQNDNICGLSYYRCFENGQIVGTSYPSQEDIVDSYANMRLNKGILGDKAEVWRTSILREYKFPEFEGEKFLSEAIVWNAISKAGYKLVFISKVIYLCEYLEDGLTNAGRKYRLQNPLGTMEHAKSFLYNQVKPSLRWKYMLLYAAVRTFAGISITEGLKRLPGYGFNYFVCLFPGGVLSFYWRIKYCL